ncbi:hypothetical protein ACTQ46_04385 [Gallicola sp. Sow4_E12]|uniref:hypothetical protein n=1 Tax=Gallicola sp. Sow4_E12 TaxID=3438785 RepID=UPI003F917BC8
MKCLKPTATGLKESIIQTKRAVILLEFLLVFYVFYSLLRTSSTYPGINAEVSLADALAQFMQPFYFCAGIILVLFVQYIFISKYQEREIRVLKIGSRTKYWKIELLRILLFSIGQTAVIAAVLYFVGNILFSEKINWFLEESIYYSFFKLTSEISFTEYFIVFILFLFITIGISLVFFKGLSILFQGYITPLILFLILYTIDSFQIMNGIFYEKMDLFYFYPANKMIYFRNAVIAIAIMVLFILYVKKKVKRYNFIK